MNADGSAPRRLTGERVYDPDWSTRGQIAFALWPRRGAPAIWMVRPDGSGLLRVVDRAEHPAWSPDGRRIAFARRASSNLAVSAPETRICVTGVDGRRVRTVARGFYPAWSPDGKRLAFVQSRRTRDDRLRFAIYTIRPDGSRRRLVARSRHELGALSWQPGR